MMKVFIRILIFVLLGMLVNCDLPYQPGPMPSEIVPTEFTPGLNILGVLRVDGDVGSSQFHIGRALTTAKIYEEDVDYVVEDAMVRVVDLASGSEFLFLHSEDSSNYGIYRDSTFNPIPEHTYELEISAPGFPTLTAHTQIPAEPELVENSLQVNQTAVSFQLMGDTDTYEYQVYVVCENTVLEQKITGVGNTIRDVVVELDGDTGTPQTLFISAMDEFLTYYSNSSISFIPNTYHADASTVTNGYGVFGSVAVATYEL